MRDQSTLWSGRAAPTVEDVAEQSANDTIRVFLLDGHEIVRRGLREALENEGDFRVVGESGMATDAIRRIPELRPHVAILDSRLPDGSGVDVCRRVRSEDPSIGVLILTTFDDEEVLLSATLAGGTGYVLRQVRGNDFLETVRRVAVSGSIPGRER